MNDFPGGSDGKAAVYNAGDPGLIPGLGRSPGEGNGNPLQLSLESYTGAFGVVLMWRDVVLDVFSRCEGYLGMLRGKTEGMKPKF